jgi:hypothetical protein
VTFVRIECPDFTLAREHVIVTRQPTGPVDPSEAARCALRPLPLAATSITGGLWAARQQINRDVAIPGGAERLQAAGNYDNLRIAAGIADGKYRGPVYQDSDIYKWLEAVSWEFGRAPSDALLDWLREAATLIGQAQQTDGYVNSYIQTHDDERFSDLPFGHELYCAGHLIQAAVASHRATGEKVLLDVAIRFADYLAAAFGPGRLEGVCGHPEIETALVELFRETGNNDYLQLASYFVDARGHRLLHNTHRDSSYFQDRVPVRDATTVEGHSVRALYLAAGVADVYAESGDETLLAALTRQWHHMVGTKTYLTGGVGSRWDGEAFGDPYELPSDVAYCETCAAIASVQWSWRMLLATGAAKYADLIERTLYNAFLPGLSLDGESYFYVNALQVRSDAMPDDSRSPANGRRPWFSTACCPPNIMRTLSSLGSYLATADPSGIQLHQYAPGTISADGFELRIATEYPWAGRIDIEVVAAPGTELTLSLRIPAWADGATVDGLLVPAASYARLERQWSAGDHVVLELPVEPRLTVGDPRIDGVRGAVAVECGPLVYCFEQVDQSVSVDDMRLTAGSLVSDHRADLLGGVTVVHATARVAESAADGLPYHPPATESTGAEVQVTAVPYYAWANREIGAMRVWVPTAS